MLNKYVLFWFCSSKGAWVSSMNVSTVSSVVIDMYKQVLVRMCQASTRWDKMCCNKYTHVICNMSFKFQSLLTYTHYMFIAINNWRNTKRTTYKQRKACIGLYKVNHYVLPIKHKTKCLFVLEWLVFLHVLNYIT